MFAPNATVPPPLNPLPAVTVTALLASMALATPPAGIDRVVVPPKPTCPPPLRPAPAITVTLVMAGTRLARPTVPAASWLLVTDVMMLSCAEWAPPSLLSNDTSTPVPFGISARPLFVITPSTQSRTSPVKSTVTNSPTAMATFVASTSMGAGTVAEVTVFSFQTPLTATTSKEPAWRSVFTYSTSVALTILVPVTPVGNGEKSNFK